MVFEVKKKEEMLSEGKCPWREQGRVERFFANTSYCYGKGMGELGAEINNFKRIEDGVVLYAQNAICRRGHTKDSTRRQTSNVNTARQTRSPVIPAQAPVATR
ncbi:hypothetical protein CBL_08131 [Carabus blaptoides fortunei]